MPNPTEQKIKNLQFKRNKTVYESLAKLVEAVKDQAFLTKPEIASMLDGELILFRYKDTTGNIATLMGCIYMPNETTREIHLEMATDEIKNIVNDKVNSAVANLKVKVDPNDKILKTDSTGNLTSNLSLTKEAGSNVIKLIGNDAANPISTVELPKNEITSADVKLEYDSTKGIIKLVNGAGAPIGDPIDLPFEQMVSASELTKDNKLKLTFNTTNGPQEVLVDLNKLKDIYEAGDKSVKVDSNKISVQLASAAEGDLAKLILDANGLKVDNTDLKVKLEEMLTNINNALTKIDLGTF